MVVESVGLNFVVVGLVAVVRCRAALLLVMVILLVLVLVPPRRIVA